MSLSGPELTPVEPVPEGPLADPTFAWSTSAGSRGGSNCHDLVGHIPRGNPRGSNSLSSLRSQIASGHRPGGCSCGGTHLSGEGARPAGTINKHRIAFSRLTLFLRTRRCRCSCSAPEQRTGRAAGDAPPAQSAEHQMNPQSALPTNYTQMSGSTCTANRMKCAEKSQASKIK